MSYEDRTDLGVEEHGRWSQERRPPYCPPAAILALLGGADELGQEAYRFGHYLGLRAPGAGRHPGNLGDEILTGKSAASDLIEGKTRSPS